MAENKFGSLGALKVELFHPTCNWFYKGPPCSVHDPRSFDDELVRSRSHHSDARGGRVGILQQRSVDVEPLRTQNPWEFVSC